MSRRQDAALALAVLTTLGMFVGTALTFYHGNFVTTISYLTGFTVLYPVTIALIAHKALSTALGNFQPDQLFDTEAQEEEEEVNPFEMVGELMEDMEEVDKLEEPEQEEEKE